jgi:hypothetical protein
MSYLFLHSTQQTGIWVKILSGRDAVYLVVCLS